MGYSLRLIDELVKLHEQVLEYELSPSIDCRYSASVEDKNAEEAQSSGTHGSLASSVSFRRFSVMSSALSGN